MQLYKFSFTYFVSHCVELVRSSHEYLSLVWVNLIIFSIISFYLLLVLPPEIPFIQTQMLLLFSIILKFLSHGPSLYPFRIFIPFWCLSIKFLNLLFQLSSLFPLSSLSFLTLPIEFFIQVIFFMLNISKELYKWLLFVSYVHFPVCVIWELLILVCMSNRKSNW